MFVDMWMTRNPISVSPELSVRDAYQLIQSKGFRRMPVTEGDRLVGIFALSDLQKTLSADGCFTGARSVADIMTRSPLTAAPHDVLEMAASLMVQNNIGCLPVVHDDKLVGLITESDIFKALVRIMGAHQGGTRITIELKDGEERFNDVLTLCAQHDVTLTSISTLYGYRSAANLLVIRMKGMDTDQVIQALRDTHYRLIHIG